MRTSEEIYDGYLEVLATISRETVITMMKLYHSEQQREQPWVSEIDKARFWNKCQQTDYCWEWMAVKSPDGYGMFKLGGKNRIASRIAYQIINGQIPEDLHVLHKCDNRGCINPDHLFTGTHQDNMLDKQRKGRGKTLGASSRYHGVSFRQDSGNWRAFYRTSTTRSVVSLGSFKSEIDAAKHRDKIVKELNLDLPLNFK